MNTAETDVEFEKLQKAFEAYSATLRMSGEPRQSEKEEEPDMSDSEESTTGSEDSDSLPVPVINDMTQTKKTNSVKEGYVVSLWHPEKECYWAAYGPYDWKTNSKARLTEVEGDLSMAYNEKVGREIPTGTRTMDLTQDCSRRKILKTFERLKREGYSRLLDAAGEDYLARVLAKG